MIRVDGETRSDGVADVELLAVASWPGGKVSFRCVGVPCDDETALKVTELLEELASGWHTRLIWFVGILKGREGIQRDLVTNIEGDRPVNFGWAYPDGSHRYFRTRVDGDEAAASFSDEMFGKEVAKSFALSIFGYWEDIIRPRIAKALGVGIQETKSDIMGEWRLLRNWLQHPTPQGDAERQYFGQAVVLPRLLGSRPGEAEISVGGMFLLMEQMAALRIEVNPLGQEPIAQFVKLDSETLRQIQEQAGPDTRIISW